ncbi:Prefoldin subunit 4 [Pisolithus orientalis]|uniref:Prefoldin subunit 4 n=1 Tax=Pisolithus orientalis TaxID=936130 RepID=UPI0022255C97|nr:Prefoldin subunit 4 [Pisolithus orientalis]KAI6001656.1 Prefoldin subunit 4 [Pisolithus orientalis]
MNNMRVLAEEEETSDGVEVTWEDQQQINTFAKLNARLKGIEDKLEQLKQEKEALDDLSTELELTDENQTVLYKLGESFLHLPQPDALFRLEIDQASVSSQLAKLGAVAEECERGMKDLKVRLYAKFGKAINLDE